ncbi:MAG: hypothetical protein LBE78_04990, partial [Burkholderiaceae bacterium]|nr:hypothetical protein [Burkholderiaceae bacterium]
MPAGRIEKLLDDIRSLDEARFALVQSLRELIVGLRTCSRSRREVCGMRIGMGCKAQSAANGPCHWQGLQRRRPP